MMDLWLTLGAALVGYLLGAISFARILAAWKSPGVDIGRQTEKIPDTDITFVMNTISATSVYTYVGKQYGCLTALLDMVKVALPTLVARTMFPAQSYDLVVATFGVLGHNWPVYHKFKGGRGESPIIGGLLVIDPLGLLVVNVVGAAFGIVLGSLLVMRWSGFLLLIPWEWYTTGDPARVVYVVLVLLMYVAALRSELRQYIRLKLDRTFFSQELVAGLLGMGKPLGRFMDRWSLFALLRKIRR
jgi:glycerol-3-phosphate acyltransferase PlsY